MTHRRIDVATAEALLGPKHPLAKALGDVRVAVGQIGAVATAAGVGLLADAIGHAFGLAIAAAAGCVAIVFAGRLCLVLDRARGRARDAIIAGGEALPVALVQRKHAQLRSSEVREELASVYEDLARRAGRSPFPPTAELAAPAAQFRALAEELRDVADLLRGDAVGIRAVARAEQLLDDGASPMYSSDVDALRSALRRIVWDATTGGPVRPPDR